MAQRRWVIRKSVPEDLEAIGKLFARVFGRPRPLAHSYWKFRENPAGHSIGMVAVDSGQIVGQYVLMPTWLRLGREVVLGAHSVDTMTHRDYRHQGIFVTLAKACTELAATKGVEALYGFPLSNTYWAFIRQLNWDQTGDIPRWVRVIRPAALSSTPGHLKWIAALGVHLLPSGRNASRGMKVSFSRPSEKDFESLLGEWLELDGACRGERSTEWFRWRFDPASQVTYQWATAHRDGTMQAWAVWGVRGWEDGARIDIMGRNPRALEAVTSAAVRRAMKADIPFLLAVTNEQCVIRALKSCGFIRRGSLPLVVRSMTARNLDGNIHNHASWQIHTADLDTF